eukprot:ANDGO_02759.mRNA.1 hypothetical protein
MSVFIVNHRNVLGFLFHGTSESACPVCLHDGPLSGPIAGYGRTRSRMCNPRLLQFVQLASWNPRVCSWDPICPHKFHGLCLVKWLKHRMESSYNAKDTGEASCPVCRASKKYWYSAAGFDDRAPSVTRTVYWTQPNTGAPMQQQLVKSSRSMVNSIPHGPFEWFLPIEGSPVFIRGAHTFGQKSGKWTFFNEKKEMIGYLLFEKMAVRPKKVPYAPKACPQPSASADTTGTSATAELNNGIHQENAAGNSSSHAATSERKKTLPYRFMPTLLVMRRAVVPSAIWEFKEAVYTEVFVAVVSASSDAAKRSSDRKNSSIQTVIPGFIQRLFGPHKRLIMHGAERIRIDTSSFVPFRTAVRTWENGVPKPCAFQQVGLRLESILCAPASKVQDQYGTLTGAAFRESVSVKMVHPLNCKITFKGFAFSRSTQYTMIRLAGVHEFHPVSRTLTTSYKGSKKRTATKVVNRFFRFRYAFAFEEHGSSWPRYPFEASPQPVASQWPSLMLRESNRFKVSKKDTTNTKKDTTETKKNSTKSEEKKRMAGKNDAEATAKHICTFKISWIIRSGMSGYIQYFRVEDQHLTRIDSYTVDSTDSNQKVLVSRTYFKWSSNRTTASFTTVYNSPPGAGFKKLDFGELSRFRRQRKSSRSEQRLSIPRVALKSFHQYKKYSDGRQVRDGIQMTFPSSVSNDDWKQAFHPRATKVSMWKEGVRHGFDIRPATTHHGKAQRLVLTWENGKCIRQRTERFHPMATMAIPRSLYVICRPAYRCTAGASK